MRCDAHLHGLCGWGFGCDEMPGIAALAQGDGDALAEFSPRHVHVGMNHAVDRDFAFYLGVGIDRADSGHLRHHVSPNGVAVSKLLVQIKPLALPILVQIDHGLEDAARDKTLQDVDFQDIVSQKCPVHIDLLCVEARIVDVVPRAQTRNDVKTHPVCPGLPPAFQKRERGFHASGFVAVCAPVDVQRGGVFPAHRRAQHGQPIDLAQYAHVNAGDGIDALDDLVVIAFFHYAFRRASMTCA